MSCILSIQISICTFNAMHIDFLESPESQMARVNTDVVFRCRHSRAETIRWSVNGSLISGNNPPSDITPSTTTVDNHFVNTLTIVAHLEYNKTEVVCVAKFDDGSPDETTDAAILTIIAGGNVLITEYKMW